MRTFTALCVLDEVKNIFHTTHVGKMTTSWLGDTMNIIIEHLMMTFSTTLFQSFSFFAMVRHDDQLKNLTKIIFPQIKLHPKPQHLANGEGAIEFPDQNN